jgi:hypothetical protein
LEIATTKQKCKNYFTFNASLEAMVKAKIVLCFNVEYNTAILFASIRQAVERDRKDKDMFNALHNSNKGHSLQENS